MTLAGSTQLMQLAGLSARLLEVHLDAADPRTSAAVAAAIDRLTDALLGWHDALCAEDSAHVAGRSRPAVALAVQPEVPDTAGLTELVRAGALDRIAVSAQVVATELARVGREVTRVCAEVRADQVPRGVPIAGAAEHLAEAVAELGASAAYDRGRLAEEPETEAAVGLAVERLRRAEHAVQRSAAATLRA